MKTHSILTSVIIFIAFLFSISGCSSSDSTDSGVPFTFSTSSAVPGEYLTVTHDSFKPITPVTITWSDDQNYSVETVIYPVANNQLKVPVPTYFSLIDGSLKEGSVDVSFSGISTTKSLNIRRPITIVYDTKNTPGALQIEWFKQNISDYNNTLNSITLYDTNTTDMQTYLLAEIQRLEAVIVEFEDKGAFTIYNDDGTSHLLSDQELRDGDALLYTTALGMLAAYQEITALQVSSQNLQSGFLSSADNLNELLDSAEAQSIAALQAVKDLRDKIPQMMSNIDGGSTLLLGGVTVVAGVAVLVGWIPAGVGVVIGGITAATYAVVTGVHSEGLAWMSSKIDEASLTVSEYEFGGELADKAKDAAVSFAFTLASGATEVAGGIAELAYTGWNMFTSKIESVCSTSEGSTSLQSLSTPLSETDQFCSEIELIIVYKDTFDFSISIPGYSGYFDKKRVAFGLGSIDEDLGYPAIAATTSIEFQPLKDDIITIMFSKIISAESYTISELGVEEGASANLFFSTPEILDNLNSDYKSPVVFSQTGGTLNLENFGIEIGDRIKGTFSITVSGDQDTCLNDECDDYTTETIDGTVIGSFDGYLKDYND